MISEIVDINDEVIRWGKIGRVLEEDKGRNIKKKGMWFSKGGDEREKK